MSRDQKFLIKVHNKIQEAIDNLDDNNYIINIDECTVNNGIINNGNNNINNIKGNKDDYK